VEPHNVVESQNEAPPHYGGRRSRSRHSAEYRDYGVSRLSRPTDSGSAQAPPPPVEQPAAPPPPRLAAPAPPLLPAPRHRSAEEIEEVADEADPQTGGQTVADLMARLQVQPSGGGRRRRRDS
jgi:hypothetical protein